jgi:hypothetical protein
MSALASQKFDALAYIDLNPNPVSLAAVAAFISMSPGDATTLLTPLINVFLTVGSDTSGPTLSIMAAAARELSPDEMMALTEVFASAPVVPPSDAFRTGALAAGLTAEHAANGAHFARCLALERLRRTGSADLIPAASQAAAVGDRAATALG